MALMAPWDLQLDSAWLWVTRYASKQYMNPPRYSIGYG